MKIFGYTMRQWALIFGIMGHKGETTTITHSIFIRHHYIDTYGTKAPLDQFPAPTNYRAAISLFNYQPAMVTGGVEGLL